MKLHFVLPLLLFSTASLAPAETEAEKRLSAASDKYNEAKATLHTTYRAELATALASCDKIELFLLDYNMEDTPSDFLFWDTRLGEDEFPILPYGSKSKILKRLVLTPEQRASFLPPLQKVVGVPDNAGGAFCHFPIHGVRLWSGDKIIFHTSFCWHCGNFAVNYPDGPSWVGIEGQELGEAFQKLMPVPQETIDGFKKQFGPKTPEASAAGKPTSDGDAK